MIADGASSMETAFIFLLIQGCLGAFDTLWYHEYKLHLPYTPMARKELRLHACRDFVYAAIFSSLAWATWNGAWAWIFVGLLVSEILVTLWDFIEEDSTRKVPPGERVMHAIMGIIYGAMLAYLLPHVTSWAQLPSGFTGKSYGFISFSLTAMAIGVFLSGLRDLLAGWRFERKELTRSNGAVDRSPAI
jgi:hypothetical protein